MYLRSELTGFECYREDVPDVRKKVPDIDIARMEIRAHIRLAWQQRERAACGVDGCDCICPSD